MHHFLAGVAAALRHLPAWQALAAALLVALAVRLLARPGPALGAAFAIAAGWFVLLWPVSVAFPPHAGLGRLPGTALLLLAATWAARRWPDRAGAIRWGLLPAAASWWLRGAPLGHGITECVPLWLGLIVGFFAAGRLTRREPAWTMAVAACGFSAALAACRTPLVWPLAALIPGLAILPLAPAGEAAMVTGDALVLLAALVIAAFDRGRLTALDAAAVSPFLIWLALRLTATGGAAPAAPARPVAARKTRRRVSQPQPR